MKILYKNINIIIENFNYSFNANDLQSFNDFYAMHKLYGTKFWGMLVNYVPFYNIGFLGLELIIFGSSIIVLFLFSVLYPIKSSHLLFNIISDHSRRFVGVALFIFAVQLLYYLQTNFLITGLVNGLDFCHGFYHIDFFSQISKLFLLLIWLGLHRFIDSLVITSDSRNVAEFSILFHIVLGFALTLLSISNFALLLISLEGFSLTLYVIAALSRLHGSIASAIKYFTFGTLGSVLIFWGIVNLYESLPSLSYSVVFYSLEYLQQFSFTYSPLLLKLEWACVAISLGFLIKIGAAPLHQWVVDVYSGVPLFITAFFSIFVKSVLFLTFVRFLTLFNLNNEIEYAAIFSLLIGCYGTLQQFELKRFLAYGSITHVGFLLMGDFVSSIVYLITYLLSSFLFFTVLLSLRLNTSEFTFLSDLKFVSNSRSPWDKFFVTIALSSLAGLPPFAGFYGKLLVWQSLLEDIYLFNDFNSYFLLILSIAVTLVVMFYYIRVITYLYLDYNDNNIFVHHYLHNFNFLANRSSNLESFDDFYYEGADWKTFREHVVEGSKSDRLLLRSEAITNFTKDSSNEPNLIKADTFNSLRYILLRTQENRYIQLLCAFIILLFTLLMPLCLSVVITCFQSILS